MRRRVIAVVTAHWGMYGKGITVETLTRRLRGKHQTVSAAVNYVMQRGWICDSGEVDDSDPSHPKILWKPTQLAVDVMRELSMESMRASEVAS